jgi:hypothetical protein
VLWQLLIFLAPPTMTLPASTHSARLPQPTQSLLGMALHRSSSSRACCLGLGNTMWQMWGMLGLRSAWRGGAVMTRDGGRKQHGCRHQETTTREWHASAAVIVV